MVTGVCGGVGVWGCGCEGCVRGKSERGITSADALTSYCITEDGGGWGVSGLSGRERKREKERERF